MPFPLLIEGQRIVLVPLTLNHAAPLFKCGNERIIWKYMPDEVVRLEDMTDIIKSSLTAKELGQEYPFAVFDKELERFVGSTRFLNISLPNKNLEIGWTWYTPEVWKTRVNTECKYELLKYCFEELGLVRVQFRADTRNERSNRALERIGAVKEGILRQDRILYDGYIRDANVYSIIDSEWPKVKQKLLDYMETD
jgi:N-acetyltransferase